jgi:hypothetical protein
VSVSLRQPHGFEGFGSVTVLARFGDLSVSQSEYMELVLFEGGAAGPAATDQVNSDDNAVARIDELLRLRLKLSVLEDLRKMLHTGVAAAMRSGPPRIVRPIPPHGGRIGQLNHCREVASVERIKPLAHQLHVLLRHRPRSIPQAQESA